MTSKYLIVGATGDSGYSFAKALREGSIHLRFGGMCWRGIASLMPVRRLTRTLPGHGALKPDGQGLLFPVSDDGNSHNLPLSSGDISDSARTYGLGGLIG